MRAIGRKADHGHNRRRGFVALGAGVALAATACGSSSNGESNGAVSNTANASGTVTVAVVSNPQMEQMEQLTASTFERQYPKIKVKFDTLNENTERAQVQQDISTGAGLYDVVMISNYETPFFAKDGWLDDLSSKFIASDPSYDASDIIKPIAQSLSYNGGLYSVPFYGESSMLYYRKSMLSAAGVSLPLHPTWNEVAAAAAKVNQPGKVAGICLRGQSGWGENLAVLDTVVNTFGGEWFNMKWQPQLTAPAFEKATKFYVDLVRQDGEPGAASDGFTELLTDYSQGKCAMWYDATVGASSLSSSPSVAADTGYAFAPVEATKASGWLYTWSLGIPKNSKNQGAAWKFLSWATSKGYIQLVGQKFGWASLPPGSRTSTYAIPQYQKAASAFASITLQSIGSANPEHPTVNPVPYAGVQFVDIPQFEALGTSVSQQISGAIAGTESVTQALQTSQQDALQSGAGKS